MEEQKQMKLPMTTRFDPCEGKIEEKLRNVLNIGTVNRLARFLPPSANWNSR
jgi:hypothetical protein